MNHGGNSLISATALVWSIVLGTLLIDFAVGKDGVLGSALHGEGFAYCWSVAQANLGITGGKY
eukprot:c16173_g1_i3 orf=2-187(-)